ncbi:MAG: hypothetical protein QM705_04185 [Ancrocorticia sp.]
MNSRDCAPRGWIIGHQKVFVKVLPGLQRCSALEPILIGISAKNRSSATVRQMIDDDGLLARTKEVQNKLLNVDEGKSTAEVVRSFQPTRNASAANCYSE